MDLFKIYDLEPRYTTVDSWEVKPPKFITFWNFLLLPIADQITHLAYWWLERKGVITNPRRRGVASYQRIEIKTDDLVRYILGRVKYVHNTTGKRPHTIYIGRDCFWDFKQQIQIHFPFSYRIPGERESTILAGCKVVFLPYMEGILPVSTDGD